MEYLVIEKDGDRFYPGKSSSDAIRYLGGFLCLDVGGSSLSWKEWVNQSGGQQDMGSNYSHLEKRHGKMIIANEIEYFEEVPNAPVFELTIPQLNYILDRWQEALETKPDKIIITKDDDGEIKVEFEK